MHSTDGVAAVSFLVEPALPLPDLQRFAADGERVQVSTTQSETAYYDTATGDLRRLSLTLSRQTDEGGWLLSSAAADIEIRSEEGSADVPDQISTALAGVARGRRLSAVATLSTQQTRHRVRAADAELVLVDTATQAVTMGAESTIHSWRTVELQGADPDAPTLAALGKELRAAGLDPVSKLPDPAASLAGLLGAEPAEVGAPSLLVADLVHRHLREQIMALLLGDVGLRLGKPVVHPVRVAARRLRSTLRVFRSVLDPEQARTLDEELQWAALVLGRVRDAEVLAARLETQLAALPAEDVLGPVIAEIQRTLAQERTDAVSKVLETLDSDRYRTLVEMLDAWWTAAPFTEAADQPAKTTSRYLKSARRAFDRRLASALEADAEALHGARKAAKRLRYAAELTEPALGKKAAKAAAMAKDLQTLLGEYQDAAVSRDFLRRLGAEVGSTPGHNGFTYGLLAGHEEARMERIKVGLDGRLRS